MAALSALVVDDDPDFRNSMALLVARVGRGVQANARVATGA